MKTNEKTRCDEVDDGDEEQEALICQALQAENSNTSSNKRSRSRSASSRDRVELGVLSLIKGSHHSLLQEDDEDKDSSPVHTDRMEDTPSPASNYATPLRNATAHAHLHQSSNNEMVPILVKNGGKNRNLL